MKIATRIGRVIRYNNPRCVAPPGLITPSSGKPIIVATLMRSGTHLLIDSLLNNCKTLRKSPLYIYFDQYVLHNMREGEQTSIQAAINRGGSRIVKTHYPQLGGNDPKSCEAITALSTSSTVITVSHDLEDISSSMRRFTDSEQSEDFEKIHSEFEKFWAPRRSININFTDLVNQWEPTFLKTLECIKIPPDGPLKPPPGRDQRYFVFISKLLTRLIGRYAPHINTTIGFNVKP